MKFLEKDLEEIIYENMLDEDGRDTLINRGLESINNLEYIVKRQLRIGNYGIADVVTLSRPIYKEVPMQINVYELKKDIINSEALIQAARYAKGINRYIRRYNIPVEIDIILIGKEIDDRSDYLYLFDGFLENVYIYKYDYKISGLEFESVSLGTYYLRGEGF